ncbi:MAG: hypothetical protein JXR60_05095 [Bacteroidales bacterium]|nr:hypothetical protein [Bacteroidales bacterium]
MKKLSILFAGLFVATTIFTSCSKDETSTGTNNIGKATITGKVWMDYQDQSNNPTASLANSYSEYAPAGTQLIAEINAQDLVQDNGTATLEKKTYYTTVDAAGNYTFSIDAGAKPVTVTIKGEEMMQAYSHWEDTNFDSTYDSYVTYERFSWSTGASIVTVVNKQDHILDITYNPTMLEQDHN